MSSACHASFAETLVVVLIVTNFASAAVAVLAILSLRRATGLAAEPAWFTKIRKVIG